MLTNVAFHVYPKEDRPIGRGAKGKLPKWLIENRGLDALEKDKLAGKLYADNLCYFRCLARYQGCGLANLERKTKELASRYFATVEHPESFAGVQLRDLTFTRLSILWGKMEKWSWFTARLTFYLNNRARKHSDLTCTMTIQLRKAPSEIQSMHLFR